MFLRSITVLLACQLAGEVIARAAGMPVPGPVLGMVLLFAGLLVKGGVPEGLQQTATGVLGHLSLLFVPAGVGVMAHLSLLEAEWDALLAALVGSTVATIAVTALVMKAFQCFGKPPGGCDGETNG